MQGSLFIPICGIEDDYIAFVRYPLTLKLPN
jgi:hypothetical protein